MSQRKTCAAQVEKNSTIGPATEIGHRHQQRFERMLPALVDTQEDRAGSR